MIDVWNDLLFSNSSFACVIFLVCNFRFYEYVQIVVDRVESAPGDWREAEEEGVGIPRGGGQDRLKKNVYCFVSCSGTVL